MVIRVLIADDHALVRAGIRGLLTAGPGVEVVAETGDGAETIVLVARHRPDVVLLDLGLPGMHGLDVIARLTRLHPEVRIVVLSMHTADPYVVAALRAGAAGYVVKSGRASELTVAVHAAARGEQYLSPEIARQVIEGYLRNGTGETLPAASLTARQREILQLIAEGHTTKEIAGRLGLSVKTVEAHRWQLMRRLDIHDLAGLVRYAIGVGLVSPER
jgi:DNA-binding NarL/FixJ family response regulator